MKPDEREVARESPGMSRVPHRTIVTPAQADALPLATGAAVRLFAWPDYADERELDSVFGTFARGLVGRDDVALCLRHDPCIDGPAEAAVRALDAAFERTLGAPRALDVLLVDDELAPGDWARLARALQAAIVLRSSCRAPRSVALAALFVAGVARIADGADLTRVLATHGAERFPPDPLLPRARGGLGSPPR